MKHFISFITSIRLAIWLVAYLAVGSAIATIVPQGQSSDAYRALYPAPIASLVLATGFNEYFRSIPFLLPSFLFFSNLSACTVKRLSRELGKKRGRHHGPDVLHLGLMALVLGGIWSYSGRESGSVTIAEGQRAALPDGSVLVLDEFRFERYADGRPRDWVSVVSIDRDGARILSGVDIRVNAPLRYEGYTYYQASYEELPAPDGTTSGDYAAVLELARDPGYPLVVMALIVIAIGTTITFWQKLKEGA
ncbi:MAG: cytochrome c biogenesis protein ResB [Spirochaetales bacterium]|nr:cytochrome c biogenesis protein ResB [Spirochaetales bacterium]